MSLESLLSLRVTPVETSACDIEPIMPHFGDFRILRVIFILLQIIFCKNWGRSNNLLRTCLLYLPTGNKLYLLITYYISRVVLRGAVEEKYSKPWSLAMVLT